METCFNYTDRERCFVSSDERRWITKITKLAEARPDEVRILRRPEENDGCIYATVPPEWIRLNPPKQLTDEQRARCAEHARATLFKRHE